MKRKDEFCGMDACSAFHLARAVKVDGALLLCDPVCLKHETDLWTDQEGHVRRCRECIDDDGS